MWRGTCPRRRSASWSRRSRGRQATTEAGTSDPGRWPETDNQRHRGEGEQLVQRGQRGYAERAGVEEVVHQHARRGERQPEDPPADERRHEEVTGVELVREERDAGECVRRD